MRISGVPLKDLREGKVDLSDVLRDFSELPNSLSTIAHRPNVLRAVVELWRAVMLEGDIEPELKYLAGYLASRSAGCMYCSAHTAQNAHKHGARAEKIEAVWDLDASPLFTPRERAALHMARAAGLFPNGVTDAHFADLRLHFSTAEIAELMSVVATYGFFNRWNDSLATPLELDAMAFGEAVLSDTGWQVGTHAPLAPQADE